KYSSAMMAAQANGLRWSEKTLDEFLINPARYIKGTRMQFPGLKNAADRANVIAYVKRRSSRGKK
ncbi:MAG: c-type cytochrome, partial [Alphaproteobacteria bacterium]